jgi:tetratricopeptide (TPR) repeat protein
VQHAAGAVAQYAVLPLPERLANAAVAYWVYLAKTFWPHALAVYYPVNEPRSLLEAALASAGLLALTAAALRLRGSRPYLAVGWLWFVGMLVPMIGLVQVGGQALADRYSYLPQTGIALALAWLAVDLLPPRREARAALAATAAAALLALGAATRAQLSYWRSSESLYRHTLAVTGENVEIERLLVTDLIARRALVEAESLIAARLRADPADAIAWASLGSLQMARAEAGDAARSFEKALALDPGQPTAHRGLGGLALERGELAPACRHLALAARVAEGLAPAALRGDLGVCMVERLHFRAALPHLEFAAEAGPTTPAVRVALALALAAADRAPLDELAAADFPRSGLRASYAELLRRAGRPAEAAAQLRQALIDARRVRLAWERQDELRGRLAAAEAEAR